MDIFGTGVNSATEAHRQEFNSAYATLEQTIRNFSKEKLMFEQTIEGLRSQLALAQQSIQKISLDYENATAENNRLVVLHEENEKNRFELDALTSAVERKQEIISDTVAGLERDEQEMCGRHEELEEFIYSLKFRQLQLKGWIDNCLKNNDDLQRLLNNERDLLTDARENTEEQKRQFDMEKTILNKEVQQLRASLEEAVTAHNNEKESLNENIQTLKLNMEKLETIRLEEKTALEVEFSLQITKHGHEKAALEKLTEELNINIKGISELLESEKASASKIQQELINAQTKMTEQLLGLEDDKVTLSEKLEDLKSTMDKHKNSYEEETARLKQDLEKETRKHIEEKTTLEKQIEMLNTKVADTAQLLDSEKLWTAKVQQELIDTKTKMAEQLSNLEVEKMTLSKALDEINLNMEQLKVAYADEKAGLQNDIEQKISLHAEEKSVHQQQLADLNERIKELSVNLESEKSLAEKTQKELSETESKINEQVANLEAEKITLTGKLEEMNYKMDKQISNWDEEKRAMKVTFEEEYAKFEEEKEEIEKSYKIVVNELKDELNETKCEKRELQKRYQDQKQAIAKMVEEVGVRPVILPSAKNSLSKPRAPILATPNSSQERSRSEVIGQVPKTPSIVSSRPFPDPTTPTRTGILKRHSFTAGDKTSRSVSFGPTFIQDFVIPSDTDESVASDGQDAVSTKEASHKRLKLSDEDKAPSDRQHLNTNSDDMNARQNTKEVEKDGKFGKPATKRYFKRGLAQSKKSPLVDALPSE